jgi:transglutaminase-like putative cysteine protease
MANTVTFKASEVLEEKHGICFAKSNLLAALLRCFKIPTGLCYQRLILDDEKYPYLVLHGFNGVYLEELNQWILLDARGNTNGINAQFSLCEEKLAFSVRQDLGEETIPIIFSSPNINVINALTTYKSRQELWNNIPQSL